MSNFVNLLDVIYPISSVYMSTSSTSPAASVGGTWTQVSTSMLGTGDSAGSYTGSKAISIAQLPSHDHMPVGATADGNETWEHIVHVFKFGSTGACMSSGRYSRTGTIANTSNHPDVARYVSSQWKGMMTGGGRTSLHTTIMSTYGCELPNWMRDAA